MAGVSFKTPLHQPEVTVSCLPTPGAPCGGHYPPAAGTRTSGLARLSKRLSGHPSKILEQSTKQKTRPMEIKGRGSLVALTAQGICAVTRIVELGGLAKTKIQPKRPQDASAVGRHAAIGIDRFLHSRQKPDSPAVFLESRRGRRFTRGAPYLGGCKSP